MLGGRAVCLFVYLFSLTLKPANAYNPNLSPRWSEWLNVVLDIIAFLLVRLRGFIVRLSVDGGSTDKSHGGWKLQIRK